MLKLINIRDAQCIDYISVIGRYQGFSLFIFSLLVSKWISILSQCTWQCCTAYIHWVEFKMILVFSALIVIYLEKPA